MEDFCGLSGRVNVYSVSDDYSGRSMTNPTVPDELRNVERAPVRVRRHVVVGSGSVIMPGVTLGLGATVGALSFVTKSVPEYAIVMGNPLRRVGTRDRTLLEKEKLFLSGEATKFHASRN